MGSQNAHLYLYRNGELVADLDLDSAHDQDPATRIFDRLILRIPDADARARGDERPYQDLIADFVPGPDGQPEQGSHVRIDEPKDSTRRVTVYGLIRLAIGASQPGVIRINAILEWHGDDPAKLIEFSVDDRDFGGLDGHPDLRDLAKGEGIALEGGFGDLLLGRIGLQIKSGHYGPHLQLYEHDKGRTYVPRVSRFLVLEPTDQVIELPSVRFVLAARDVVQSGLNSRAQLGSDANYAWVDQILNVDLRTDYVQCPSPVTGDWTVRIAGIPTPSVLTAWNHYVAKPYFEALRTVRDGRSLSAMPYLSWNGEHRDIGWVLGFSLRERGTAAEIPCVPEFAAESNPLGVPGSITFAFRSCEPWFALESGSHEQRQLDFLELERHQSKLQLIATFARFVDHDGQPIQVEAVLDHAQRESVIKLFGFRFTLRQFLRPKATLWFCRSFKIGESVLIKFGNEDPQPFFQTDDETETFVAKIRDSLATNFTSEGLRWWSDGRRLGVIAVDKNLTDKIELSSTTPGVIADDVAAARFGSLDLRLPMIGEPPAESFENCRTVGRPLFKWDERKHRRLSDNWFPLSETTRSIFNVRLRHAEFGLHHTSALPTVDNKINLAVLGLFPGGQDPLPHEEYLQPGSRADTDPTYDEEERAVSRAFRREDPILVFDREQWRGDESDRPMFVLNISEETGDQFSQTFSMRLQRNPLGVRSMGGGSEREADVIVIDRHPFTVAKVSTGLFTSSADGLRELGNWSGEVLESSSWELAGTNEGVRLVLPPQAVGEATEKFITEPEEIPVEERQFPEDVMEGQLADFRFSPCASLLIRSSFFNQRFTESPWNLRRILGYVGQRSPGPQVISLDWELLYGLHCQVTRPDLRIAELSSTSGAFPGELPRKLPWRGGEGEPDFISTHDQREVFRAYRRRWSRQYAQLLSRLGLFVPWFAHPHTPLEISDPRFLRYRIRPTANLLYPVADVLASDKRDPVFKGEGLAGGVTWGFEFPALVDELLAEPESTSAELARPALSALGGWGYQKASFNGNKTTIYSDTSMGRTFYYAVERIGRIGIFWNRAKHVIVYERTVGPKERFLDQQDPLLGRPVLRKVKEYVEILEPERRFGTQDRPLEERQQRGCVLGNHFKSIVINVDSRAWGSQVFEGENPVGVKIPLWQRGANPQHFPKPHVLAVLAADPAQGANDFLAEIDEPEKLVFFTSVREEDDDRTDEWKAVASVDFIDLPIPQPEDVPTHQPGDLDAQLPPAPQYAPGFDAFSFGLVTTDARANLSVERSDNPMGAILKNINVSRSKPAVPRKLSGNAKEVIENLPRVFDLGSSVQQGVENGLRGIVDRMPRQITKSNLAGIKKRLLDALNAENGLFEVANKVKNAEEELAKFLDKVNASDPQVLIAANLEKLQASIKTNKKLTQFYVDLRKEAKTIVGQLRGLDESQARAIGEREFKRLVDKLRIESDFVDVVPNEVRELERKLQAVIKSFHRMSAVDEIGITKFELDLRDITHVAVNELLPQVERTPQANLDALAKSFLYRLRRKYHALLSSRFNQVIRLGAKRLAAIFDGDSFAEKLHDYEHEVAASIQQQFKTLHEIEISSHEDARRWLKKINDELSKSIDLGPIGAAEIDLLSKVKSIAGKLNGWENAWNDWINTAEGNLLEKVKKLPGSADDLLKEIDNWFTQKKAHDEFEKIAKEIKGWIDGDGAPFLKFEKVENFEKPIRGLATSIKDKLDEMDTVEKFNDLRVDVEDLLQGANVDKLFPAGLDDYLSEVRNDINGLAQHARDWGKLADGVMQEGDKVFKLLRAFGDAPVVPQLGFNRGALGYYYNQSQQVDITPVTTLVDRVGGELKPLGVRLPTDVIKDKLDLNGQLPQFDIDQILPDFSGLKLGGLFEGLKIPDDLKDNIKIEQGIDKQSLKAWLKASIHFDLADDADIFSFGPLKFTLLDAVFHCDSELKVDASGAVSKSVNGWIRGDWLLSVGGMSILTFLTTELTFDQSGKMKFHFDPSKIRLDGLLQAISDVVSNYQSGGDEENGFSYKVLEQHGLPIGITAMLNLPIPNIQFGVVGIMNLRFTAALELLAKPRFAIGVSFGLAQQMAPFTISVFILGGAGWITVGGRYEPETKALIAYVSIGIAASASLALTLGVVEGSVAIYLGIKVEYYKTIGTSGEDLDIAIFLLLRGHVDVLGGLASATISILLELTYQSETGALIGRGTISIKVKICWCFTFKFKKSITLTFKKGKSDAVSHRRDAPQYYLVSYGGQEQAEFTDDLLPTTREEGAIGAILSKFV